jgi:hypothetical protein
VFPSSSGGREVLGRLALAQPSRRRNTSGWPSPSAGSSTIATLLAREIPGARLLVLEQAATAIPDSATGEVAAAMLAL